MKYLDAHPDMSTKEISKVTDLSSSLLSQELKKLDSAGYLIVDRDSDKRFRRWSLSHEGRKHLFTTDQVVASCIDRILDSVSEEYRRVIEASSLATVLSLDRVVMRGNGYDFYSACLETILYVELIYKISSQIMEISLTELRILLALEEQYVSTEKSLSNRLFLIKTSLSSAISSLVRKNLISASPDKLDKRWKHLSLTEQGRARVDLSIAHADTLLLQSIRKTSDNERRAWLDMARLFVLSRLA